MSLLVYICAPPHAHVSHITRKRKQTQNTDVEFGKGRHHEWCQTIY